MDNEPTSVGRAGKRGARNSPSVFHAAGHFAQFWDGRAPDVEEQAKGRILSEMAMINPQKVVAVLRSIPGYGEAFRRAFPKDRDPLTYANVGRAIGAFERKLVTPSRWDRFVDGDAAALTPVEVEGLKVFVDIGCVQCHTGEYVGGSMFQKVGVAEAWPNQKDPGRYQVTRQEGDRMQFKVPSLRNVAKTAPYFHDGSAKTLEEAVKMMARYQLGVTLTKPQVALLTAWLRSLTGELPQAHITPPALPPSGASTTKVSVTIR